MPRRGIKIRSIEAGSPADAAGLHPGDEILAANGNPVQDELALKFYLAEDLVKLEVRRTGGGESCLELDLGEGRPFGAEVEDFRTRTCNNACLFCFIHQLPPGARQSLKIKDDDFRLSFLHGNYITLTNLAESDLERVISHALSPLYVSIHATDPELRTRIMGRKKVDDLAGKLRQLVEGGIRIHAQIVLMPGINDGRQLEKTVSDLRMFFPGVSSVAIVPLGLSDHGAARGKLVPVTPDFCREVIRQVTPWHDRFRKERGLGFTYLADEFYIQGQVPIPRREYYDDFAQIEDGVGMVRRYIDEFGAQLARRRRARPRLRGTLATGSLFYPFLRDCIRQFNLKLGSALEVVKVENRFMGKGITVAGLLAGRDFAAALAGRALGDFVIVPGEALSPGDRVFVDDQSPAGLADTLGKPVHTGGRTVRDFFGLLCDRL